MKYKVTFEMDLLDFENLLSIINKDVVKCKYESKTDDSLSKPEVKWLVRHGDYVEKKILNKIIKGATKV